MQEGQVERAKLEHASQVSERSQHHRELSGRENRMGRCPPTSNTGQDNETRVVKTEISRAGERIKSELEDCRYSED